MPEQPLHMTCVACWLQVNVVSSGRAYIDTAPITTADVPLSGGVLHKLGGALTLDWGFNASLVAQLERAGDFGPFTDAEVIMQLAEVYTKHISTY